MQLDPKRCAMILQDLQNDVIMDGGAFSDSGAHVCQEMGSSLQTHLLSYWVRNKQQFTLEEAVRMLTFDNASAWELSDRGLVRTGYAADLVVFDAPTGVDAVRTLAARTAVVSRGRVVARTSPARTSLHVGGEETPVSFLR